MVKFIHCADLHLDSPFSAKHYSSPVILKDMENSAYESFKNIIDLALRQEVDFLLISGDIFDAHNHTLRAEIFFKAQMERLRSEQIFVYIVFGNHDPLVERITTKLPENVTVFSDQVETYQAITKNGETIHFHGFSYLNRESYENKIDEYPTNEDRNVIHIGLLHGTYHHSHTKNRFTEFRIEDLNSKLYHYWALGHIHERQQLSDLPEIHYPGNIQGRHFNEQGEKGCLLVEGDHVSFQTQFIPTHFVRFDEATIQVDETNMQHLYEEIQAFKKRVRHLGRAIYRLNIEVSGDTRFETEALQQVQAMILDYEENEHHFVVIDEMNIKYLDLETSSISKEFPLSLLEDNVVFDKALDQLYTHPKASKYLDNYGTFNRQVLIERAEAMIKDELKEDHRS
ncbi:metallophosphoesterase family protein [Staphylococcus canis]|uniref:DNA repair exonuclease n=1 Tax=Staphylococcus canis TaxID=2724942 RepID=A0ABS0TCU0_9STAP|nr:DNA repair exonuclease [Staphylococcus canis]MBI5975786.1 DNA repair exonuclease [Staphylococcus canis]